MRWPENMSLWQQWEAMYTDLAKPQYKTAARKFYDQHRPAMDAGRDGALARGGRPLHADVHAGRGRADGVRAREAELADQSRPVRMAGVVFRRVDLVRRVAGASWWSRRLALDPSKGSDARRGDYSAFVMLGVDRQGMVYVEADLARRPTPQIVADGVELFRRFRPDVFGVEANQFQDLLAGEFEAEFRRQGMLGARPWPIENRTNKLVRIRRLGPYLSSAAAAVQERQSGHAAAGRAAPGVSHRRSRRRPRRRRNGPAPGGRTARRPGRQGRPGQPAAGGMK